MANNFLALKRPDTFEEQVRLFTTENAKVQIEEITNEDLQEAERQEMNESLNSFFGFDGGFDDLLEMYQEDVEMLAEKTKDDVIKKKDLESNVEDPFHQKAYEQQKTVFSKRIIEENKEMAKNLSFTESTDYVKNDTPKRSNSYYGTSRSNSSFNTSTTDYGSRSTSKSDSKPKEKMRLNDRVAYVAENVMDVATKPVKGWKESPADDGWGGKKSWKKKLKYFMRTKKAKILLKTGMLMTLQLGMAMVGKKYEFEGIGQTAMFLGMMMGVFYLTRELVEDGFDPRGFGIL